MGWGEDSQAAHELQAQGQSLDLEVTPKPLVWKMVPFGAPNHPFFLTAPPLLPHIPSASPRLWSCAPEAAAESHDIPQGSRFGGTPTFGGLNHPFPTEPPLLPSLPYAPQNPGLDLQKLLLLNHIPCPPCPPIWRDPHSLGGDPRPRARRSTLTISAQAGPEAEVPESTEAAARAATPTGQPRRRSAPPDWTSGMSHT